MHLTTLAHEAPASLAYAVGGTNDCITRGELEARSNHVAHLLRSAGLSAGDHVALLFENSLDLLVAV